MSPMPADLQKIYLLAPVSGVLLDISKVPDPAFSQKMVGDGIAIDPTDEMLVSPCIGRVTQLHSAHHALTVTTPEGVEVLMHIGLDTVALKGQGFTPKVKEGDDVIVGQPLIAFDADFLARNASSVITIMIIANGERVAAYEPAKGMARAGETVALGLSLASGGQSFDSPANSYGNQSGASSSSASQAAGPEVSSDTIVILNPTGLHARPAALLANSAKRFSSSIKLVKDGREANAKSVVALMSLNVGAHDRVTVKASGDDAGKAVESLTSVIASGLGENVHVVSVQKAEPVAESARPRPASDDPGLLLGVPASPGLVFGQVYQLRHQELAVEEKGQGLEVEKKALLLAVAAAKKELKELQARMRDRADAGKAAIFAAHEELLDDPELLETAGQDMEKGFSAAFAWQKAYQAQAKALAHLGNELLAARANDIRDVGRRVLLHLTGVKEDKVEMPSNIIIIAEDLTPSDTAGLDQSRVLGFCTTGGSSTSHASILARSAGIPAVAAIEERALEIPDKTIVILDGEKGELRLNPSEEVIASVRQAQEKAAQTRAKELAEAGKPAQTLDGVRIKVVGNIGGTAEAAHIAELGGEGVGLLRSEFLFLQRAEAPSESEQSSVYTAIAKTLGPERDMVVRTLDVGGDKPLAYLPLPGEANPFLGIRGIRLNLLNTDLFRTQIRAILSAAAFSKLHIMFPMVSGIDEFRAAKDIVLKEKEAMGVTSPVAVGMMVEVPSAALEAADFAKEVDFFSIGTNDLTQYTLAIDRGHPRLAKMADSLHPAVLKLMAMAVEGAHAHGKWVGVCGGLAGDLQAIPILVGLGVDELSVSVASIPSVKARVRALDRGKCRALAREVMNMMTAAQVRARLKEFDPKEFDPGDPGLQGPGTAESERTTGTKEAHNA